MKHLNLLFKFLAIPFLFIQRSSLRYFLLITLSLISINSTAYADACSDMSGTDKKTCEADKTCTWTQKGETCATVSTGGGNGGSGGKKLELYKNASPQYIEEDRTISYIVTLINGENSDGNYTLHDNLPEDIFGDGDINITESGNFTCDVNLSREDEIVCNGIVPSGSVAHIFYTAVAPDTGMQITNTVRVTEDSSTTTLLSASVTVTVLPNYNGDLDYSRDICYIPQTDEEIQDCLYSNQFSYGPECQSEIALYHVSDRELLNVHIFKSYSSAIETEDCYSKNSGIDCDQTVNLNDTLHRDSSLFFREAFDGILDFNLGNMSPDSNDTIVDINTEPLNNNDFQYIALIGQYNIPNQTETVEEYIYSCFASGGGSVLQDTSGGANDVNLLNNDFSAEDNSVALGIPYQTYDKVGTKIVNQPFLLGINYLDANKNPADFEGSITDESDKSKPISAAIVLQWKANGQEHALWSGELAPDDDDLPDTLITYKKFSNDLDNTRPYPIIDEAFENGQILVKLIDYPSFLAALDKGSPCAKNSSFTGNLCNVPSCFNAPQQIFNVFPVETYPLVATCVYGDGGGAAPCDSNAYTGHCKGNKLTISPDKYNHYDGCAQCLGDAVALVESSNSFSTRPYSYELTVPEWENGLNKSGVNYPIDLNATTADPNISRSDKYITNSTITASIALDTTRAPMLCPYTDPDEQTIEFFDLINGYTREDGLPAKGGYSTNEIKYSNVGETILSIVDQNWTKIDWYDVVGDPECIFDSNATDPTLDPLHRGRVGCKLIVEQNLTFVPFTFDIDANLSNHNTGGNFTYLNDFNDTGGITDMAASLDIDITAVNADGNRTSNYIDGCYAKDNNLSLTFDPFSITPTDNITHMLYYNVIDDNKSDILLPSPQTNILSLPEPLQSTSASFLPGGNGTAIFAYKLNFNRKIDQVVQAFAMNLTDVNITDTDNVEGNQTGITGQTAFMYYAKARPSVGIGLTYTSKTEVALTPILIHVYCDPGGVFSIDPSYDTCADLGISLSNPWGISEGHNSDAGDGNITLKVIDPPVDVVEGSGTPSLAYTKISIISAGEDDNLTVNRGPNPTFPLTVNIELDATSDAWLIHNPFSLPLYPSPFYKVKFISPSIWAGPGGTGSVVDTDVNTNSNKRSNW